MSIMIDRDRLLIEIAGKQSLLKQGPEELIGGRIYWQCRGLDLAAQLIQGMSVDAEPVRHGHWLVLDDIYGEYARCSVCGDEFTNWEADCALTNYCPACGAKMDGGVEHETD